MLFVSRGTIVYILSRQTINLKKYLCVHFVGSGGITRNFAVYKYGGAAKRSHIVRGNHIT